MVLLAIIVSLLAIVLWVAATAAAEENFRSRRSQRREALRDLDMKR
jgi:hypothetical protein